MSQRGVLQSIKYKEYGGGKTMAILAFESGDGAVAFGKTVDSIRRLSEGTTVEYSSKPSEQEGRDPMVTFIKAVGATIGSVMVVPQGGSATKPTNKYQGDSRNEDDKQLSIFFGYAKDIVTSGIVKSPVATPTGIADLVGTLASELRRKYQALRGGESVGTTGPANKTPVEAVGAMTETSDFQ